MQLTRVWWIALVLWPETPLAAQFMAVAPDVHAAKHTPFQFTMLKIAVLDQHMLMPSALS